MLWFQGFEHAPDIVKKCHASWVRHNPGWDIRFLDEKLCRQYVDLDTIVGKNAHGVKKQALSDILRINLLAEHGGAGCRVFNLSQGIVNGRFWRQIESCEVRVAEHGRQQIVEVVSDSARKYTKAFGFLNLEDSSFLLNFFGLGLFLP